MNSTRLACGIDLGGTKIAIGLIDSDGVVGARVEIRDHQSDSEDRLVDRIAESVRTLLDNEGLSPQALTGIGVGTSGHVDYSEGRVISNSNLKGFSDYPLANALANRLKADVSLDNDANAQAYAEYRFGAGRGQSNVLFVTISTGLGAGIIIDGQVYHGVTGTAGEIGHTIVNPDGNIRCGCGNYGCLMAHGSGLTLPEAVSQKLKDGISSTVVGPHTSAINGELIGKGLAAGDPLCIEIVSDYARYLAIGLHNAVQTLNPGIIVLGGGLTRWGEPYLEPVREQFRQLASATLAHPPEIRLSELEPDAAMIGAAALAVHARSSNE